MLIQSRAAVFPFQIMITANDNQYLGSMAELCVEWELEQVSVFVDKCLIYYDLCMERIDPVTWRVAATDQLEHLWVLDDLCLCQYYIVIVATVNIYHFIWWTKYFCIPLLMSQEIFLVFGCDQERTLLPRIKRLVTVAFLLIDSPHSHTLRQTLNKF